ncbi:hypothetical protein N0V84_009719 [Fusarium piperis]|uniref:NACHT domain-containing protein n=1 Tax=Fusarium piperis TaxID=1435070 RepID=A0A9W8W5T0_9HYPO|nr:hypothetical protein N0V84_009719 [Fusarium piperis]
MAELAAIALAGNVLQFLEVGIKLTKTARKAYKSKSGLIEEDEEFLANTKLIQSLAGVISQHQSASERNLVTGIDESLRNTARACSKYSTDLIALLEHLRIESGGNRAWETIRALMLRRQRNAEIEVLQGKLVNARRDLIFTLTTASHSQQSAILTVVRQLKNQNAELEANTTTKLKSIESLLQETDVSDTDVVAKIVSRLNQLADEARQVQQQHGILRSLLFLTIKQRHSAIQDCHKATFDWIFSKKKTGFCDWLETGNGFFWVKGKAGSGKSTLMKFITSHDSTRSKLQIWGAGKRVITASHFFWNAGNSMQKSLTGLFRTILYQVLKACPELIEIVCASRWEPSSDPSVPTEPWDEAELVSAFKTLSCQKSLTLKFCFFIDGLDEFTAGGHRYTGTFEELLDPLRALASSDSIKICVSSRPWDAFEKEFSKSKWKIQLEDLTREDIRRYVKEELGADSRFQALSRTDGRCGQIPDIIVKRAQGVFLWVYLVVNSLKQGLFNDDDYSDLQQRLDELPDDLQRYFEHMLQSIEAIYWDKTTRIFRAVVCAEQSLPLLGFGFLDQEMDNPGYAITMQTRPLSEVERDEACQRLKTRLNARCRDLLYVTNNVGETGVFRYQVDFLHRTVRDFFLDTGVLDDIMQQRPTKSFDPHLSLCKIMLGLSKIMATDKLNSQVYNHLFTLADSLMYYARNVEETHARVYEEEEHCENQESVTELFDILDELDRLNSERLGHLGLHWTNIKDPPKGTFQEWRKKTFLAAAIQAGLLMYVEDRLRKNPSELQQKGGRPLLDYALRPTMVTPRRMLDQEQGPVLPIVKLLLEHGADPNARIYIYDQRTPWELFLWTCYQHVKANQGSKSIVEDLGTTIQVMISHGARGNCSVQIRDDAYAGVIEVACRMGLPPYQVDRIQELIQKQTQSLFSFFLSLVF